MVGDDSPGHCILGVGARGKKTGPVRKFLNHALILAKRNITMHWKAAKAPSILNWYNEMIRWGRAEGTALQKEEKKDYTRNRFR